MTGKKFLFFNISVFFAWTALLSLLLYQTYWGTPFEKTGLIGQHFRDRTIWYAIYSSDRKVGFAKSILQEVGDEIIIRKESSVTLAKDGTDDETKLIENLRCLCSKEYTLKTFEYSSRTDSGEETVIEGRVEDDIILLFIEQKGKKHIRKVATEGRPFFLPATLVPAIHSQKPARQSVYRVTILDLVNTRLVDTRVTLDEIVPVKVGIDIRSVYKYNVAGSFIWTNDAGFVIKEQHPAGMKLYAQPESIALESTERLILDYTSLPFFKATKVIPDPEGLTSMKVKVTGIALETIESESTVTSVSDLAFVTHKIEQEELKKASYRLPNTEESLKQYLRADQWISSDNKILKDTGQIYAKARDSDAFKLSSYLISYVHNLVRAAPHFELRDSATIREHLEGDHIEKSLMFATYARAGGLPTRLMGGLVYRNGYFFFHTWPEVWFGKWVPVDPSLYQFPADATHIPMVTGSMTDIISIIDDLKSIKLEILEAS